MDKIKQSWLDIETSLFNCAADTNGHSRTFRQILFSDFAVPHNWFYKEDNKWINGSGNDLETINKIRRLDKSDPLYIKRKGVLKSTLQAYTPSANCQSRKKQNPIIRHYNQILQMDFDDVENIHEIKAWLFSLPFVCLVAISASGTGLFCFILFSEPEKLSQYAEHLFFAFAHYGLIADTSKGRNYNDYRFCSYDANMLVRDNPEPLTITNFHKKAEKKYTPISCRPTNGDGLIKWGMLQIENAPKGQRFKTIRKIAFLFGGYGDGLEHIKATITNCPQYWGEENEFLSVAEECYSDGTKKPIAI